MHRLFLGFCLSALTLVVLLTGCNQSHPPQGKDEEKVLPGVAKPAPAGDAGKPSDPDALATRTDPNTLPVLPKLNEPTGDDKYEAALARAFVLAADNKDAEALAALKEAQAVKQTDFVKAEITRLTSKLARTEAAKKAADGIKQVLDAGQPEKASQLATDALAQFGDSDMAETITSYKRQADALVSASPDGKQGGQRFLAEAETARKANNLRGAVLAYEQAIAGGADAGEVKQSYDTLRGKLASYDENRSKAAELRKDPGMLDEAVAALKEAQKNWDTLQVQQEIAEAENALVNRKDRVAVADFEEVNDVGIPRAGHVLAEELTGQMRPRFDVVERSHVRALLTEMKADANDLTVNETSRTEFGKLARARYVVLGSVSQLGGIRVNARLVDTNTGLVKQTAQIVAATPEEMSNRLPALGRMLQMTDDEKRSYEAELAKLAKPVTPPPPAAEVPAPPPPPPAILADPAKAAPPPPPIVMYTPRPPEFGAVVAADFNGFRVVAAGVAPPPPVVVVEGPAVVRDRALFVAVEVGDNLFRRGMYVEAMRQFEFALALNPGHPGIRFRVDLCRPFCPPPVVVVPLRPRLVVLPFVELRDPAFSSIPPGLGVWTADAIAPYFQSQFDVVSGCEVFWWMARLGISVRDVLTDPYARLYLGRALGARFFLMGSLRDVASFDATTRLVDAELNVQTGGATIRVQNAAELNFRLGQLASLTTMPPAQQVVVIQQQQVVQQKVIAAQIEFRKGNFSIALGMFQEVQTADPTCVEARQMTIEIDLRSRRRNRELDQLAEFQRQQAEIAARLQQQKAFMAAVQQAQNQAQQNLNAYTAMNQQALDRQKQVAEQNLLAQAAMAQKAADFQRRVALMQSAYAIRKNQEIAQQLAVVKAEFETARRKQVAATEQVRQAQLAQVAKIQSTLETARQKQAAQVNEAVKATQRHNQEEYNRLVALGNEYMTSLKHAQAAAAFQTAKRLQHTAEIEQLIAKALTEQARAAAAAKSADEKKRFEAQLALEEKRKQQLEAAQATLKAKYQAAWDKAQAAMQARQYDEAVVSYRLAAATMQTAEVTVALKQANAELAKAKEAAALEAKKKAHDQQIQTAVNKKLAEGRAALAAKKYDQAIAAFKSAVALKPGDVELQTALAEAETARDQGATVRKDKEPIKTPTEPDRTQVAYTTAMTAAQAAFEKKQYDDAIRKATEALHHKPGDPAASNLLAAARKADTNAGTTAADAKKKQQAYLTALREASTALSAKKYEAAITAAQEALAAKPGDPSATKILNDATRAMQAAKTAATESEKRKEAFAAAMQSGRAALTKKNYDAAIKEFEEALKFEPRDPTATALLKQAQDARSEAGTNAKRKQLYEAWLDRAEKLMAAKQYENAVEAYQYALRAMPGDAVATKGLASAKEAMTAKKEPVPPRKDPTPTKKEPPTKKELYDAWLERAEQLMAAKQYQGAVQAYQNALLAMPGDPTATRRLAVARAALNPQGETVPPKKDPVVPKTDPNAARVAALLKHAAGLENATKYADAYEAYQEVLKLAPTNAEAKKQATFCQWMEQGVRLLNAGQKDQAAASFQRALQIDPSDANAKRLLQQAQAPAPKPKKK